MTREELKALVKLHFNLVEAPTVEKFGEIEDENKAFKFIFPGDKLEVGSEIKVITTEGQEMPAPEGEHILSDGKVIMVMDGKVAEISTKAEELADKEEEMAQPMAKKEEDEVAKKQMYAEVEDEAVEAKEEKMEITEVVAEVATAVEEKFNAVKVELDELKEKFAKLSYEPAGERTLPIPAPKMAEKFSVDDAANAKQMKAMLEAIKNK
jgi:hypothetical protein